MSDGHKTFKYTPGPWKVCAPPDKVCTNYGGDKDVAKGGWGKVIVTCRRSSWMSEGEEFANAQLISAAPDLLDALKDARYALYGNGPGNLRIDAAIAKAEGRSR